jgi:hypothetical protein
MPGDEFDDLREFLCAGRFAVAGKGDVVDAARFRRHALHEVAMLQFVQKSSQLFFQQRQVDGWCSAARKIGDLTLDAAPVAGIVWIEIDTDRNAARTARDDRIHITQSGTVAVVVGDVQFGKVISHESSPILISIYPSTRSGRTVW